MMVEVAISDDDLAVARRLAQARLTEVNRRRSPDRQSARNTAAQVRGAVGEVAAAHWLEQEGFSVQRGYERDEEDPDLIVDGVGIEVMTAQLAHREATGICVPPGKLRAARGRNAAGYLFVGTDASAEPGRVWMQAYCPLAEIDLDAARNTAIRAGGWRVMNHVVRADSLRSADELPDLLRQVPSG